MIRYRRLTEIFLVVLLICTGLFFLTYKLALVSATYDEGFSYLGNGEYLVRNFRWDRPYILLHPPLSYYLHGWSSLIWPQTGDARLYTARLSMLPIYILFAILIYIIIRRWYGQIAAISALILYLFNPEILAHARLVTPDHLLAFTIFLTLISFYAYLRQPIFSRWLITGVALGLALLSKYTGLLLVPLLIILGFVYCLNQKRKFREILVGWLGICLVAILLLHVGYIFRETGKLTGNFVSPNLQRLTRLPLVAPFLQVVLPRAYLEGADFQIFESGKGVWWGFFHGSYYQSGLWYFYPAVFAIKTPLGLLMLLILACGLILTGKLKSRPFLFRFLLLSVVWFGVYFMFFNKLLIGLRYLLMIYPLLFVFIAPIFSWQLQDYWKKITYRIVMVLLLGWYVAGSVKIAPFYLAFANETIGGPKNLWKFVSDSSLDWNQDQKFFDLYRRQHPELKIINPHQPIAGKIAVNVNDMNLYYFYDYQWLRQLKIDPVDNIGYTWLIFEITQADLQKLNLKGSQP